MQAPCLVGFGVDTLVLNVRYADEHFKPVKKELDEALVATLEYFQQEAKQAESAIATDWAFQGSLLFIEPHGAGRQWRWLLKNHLLTLVVAPGRFNDIIAQVRFSS
ncbi:hypothetical protein EI42_06421 [Thermosporothrix hazakensis]|jgi:hypothetical protein|uniref:Uncharacterized protein n=1 Tax=Thermosporothrix hazakensis TaxID=644383 RepID=A0A326TQA9_THEHA|nr:hypothetical protein [Thermosporothrix hazakensis]PZW18014.1 hypothetical protein EI42_06421 [Thermosporothrix hazakensis]GCE50483.1 hypothetical protein KTH_53520 [Thermosporothrix hazakensis]